MEFKPKEEYGKGQDQEEECSDHEGTYQHQLLGGEAFVLGGSCCAVPVTTTLKRLCSVPVVVVMMVLSITVCSQLCV